MNFNISPPVSAEPKSPSLVSLLCRVWSFPLLYRTPITTCPAEGRNNRQNVDFPRSAFFSSRGWRLGRCLTSRKLMPAVDSLWWAILAQGRAKIQMSSIHQAAALKLMSTYFHLLSTIPWQGCICQPQLLLTFLIFIRWADRKSGDAKSVHPKPFVVCH